MEYQYKDRGLITGRNSVTPSKAVSDYVWQRDGGICIYCGNPAQVLDHVIRWADNRAGISSNLVCSCQKCNTYKGKHPRGLKQLTRAIFWLMTHGEDLSWMGKFYSDIDKGLKRPKSLGFDREKTEAKREIQCPLSQRRDELPHKNYRPSSTTKPVVFRLPNALYFIVERRAKKKKLKVSEYLKRKTTYEATRPH